LIEKSSFVVTENVVFNSKKCVDTDRKTAVQTRSFRSRYLCYCYFTISVEIMGDIKTVFF